MNELELLKQRVEELEKVITQLQQSSKIPLKFDQSFRGRFQINDRPVLVSSAHTGETTTINEGGAATKVVAAQPDGFYENEDGTKFIPYYT